MLNSIAAWAVLAATLVQGAFTSLKSFSVHLDARDSSLETRDVELDTRVSDLEKRDIESRDNHVVRNGFADFERFNTNTTSITEIGYYGGLQWKGFGMDAIEPQTAAQLTNNIPLVAIDATRGPITAIRPQSPTNFAAYGALNSTMGRAISISAQFEGSKTLDFSISSFYFGCAGASTGVPAGCKVAITGYNPEGNPIAYQLNYFTPKAGLKNNMQLVQLSNDFKDLGFVIFKSTYVGNNT
ncbi:hypothetical protein TruAng_002595 [Truncatella angustata]|nr:hypothetical protein TruAng_002595 [Truncatella angustata]